MAEPTLVCPHCGQPVARQVVWRKLHEQHLLYECEQHQAVVPVLKELSHV